MFTPVICIEKDKLLKLGGFPSSIEVVFVYFTKAASFQVLGKHLRFGLEFPEDITKVRINL